MNHAKRMLEAMTGPHHGLRAAWIMFRASYSYTRSWDGCDGPDGKLLNMGRWYAFREAMACGARYLSPQRLP